jgi:acetylornithine deacetylase/succinyl-diaminopimelate desuccinylase family protein
VVSEIARMMPPSVVELLRELIRIPSVNPDGDPGTDGVGEQRVAEYLQDLLRGIGAEVELREVEPGRPNLVARFPGGEGKPRLLFAPHTDTVSVKGMVIDPFAGDVRDGRVWGRGASDTKGSITAMVWALAQCGDRLGELSHEIWFAGLMGEEAGLQGSKALAAEESFDFVIAGEPTGLDVVNATKGCTWATVRTRGRAVHASMPERGMNAIYQMTEVVRFLRDEVGAELAAMADAVLGSPTMSVGVIAGGSKANIVPDACELRVDFRTIPGQSLDSVFERVRGMRPEVEVEVYAAEPMLTDAGHPVIGRLESLGAKCVGAPWFCDGANFASRGVPAVAVGPGSIAQAHTEDEFIAVADLEAGAEFFERFLRSLSLTTDGHG